MKKTVVGGNQWKEKYSRMYGMYIPNQKFYWIRISVLRDITKIWKKITHIKDVKNIYFT